MPVSQTSFQDRIKSISNPKNKFYVDPETGTFIPKRVSKAEIRNAKARAKVAVRPPGVMGFVGSILLGGLCLMAARYGRWHYLNIRDGSAEADVLMMVDFGLAVMAVFFVGAIVRHTSFRHMVAQAAGIGVMLVSMHNLIWAFPEEFAQVYSTDYVQEIRDLTAPQSIYLRGQTITL